MTDLQLLYLQARAGNKRRHHAALREVSAQTGIDPGTVDRSLRRARRADERDERQRKEKP